MQTGGYSQSNGTMLASRRCFCPDLLVMTRRKVCRQISGSATGNVKPHADDKSRLLKMAARLRCIDVDAARRTKLINSTFHAGYRIRPEAIRISWQPVRRRLTSQMYSPADGTPLWRAGDKSQNGFRRGGGRSGPATDEFAAVKRQRRRPTGGCRQTRRRQPRWATIVGNAVNKRKMRSYRHWPNHRQPKFIPCCRQGHYFVDDEHIRDLE